MKDKFETKETVSFTLIKGDGTVSTKVVNNDDKPSLEFILNKMLRKVKGDANE